MNNWMIYMIFTFTIPSYHLIWTTSSRLVLAFPLGVILQSCSNGFQLLKLLCSLLKLLLVILGHHPHLQCLSQNSSQQANNIFPSDAAEVWLKCLPLLAGEEEGLPVNFPADEVEVVLQAVVRLEFLSADGVFNRLEFIAYEVGFCLGKEGIGEVLNMLGDGPGIGIG